eukprot:TRINITY_DN44939_c0_g3_i2.p1 TRINITY_DN44939_c0_g3~~TRINITY_DN44939_c0_g3_i2.p1  ORF type:complete len:2055 (+),score=608.43 TRINITY_DN44939_c0_g3_i2:86-6250(+)
MASQLSGNGRWKPDTAIKLLQDNPKRQGSKAADRYEKYKKAKTAQELLDMGGVPGDLTNDYQAGYLTITDGTEIDLPTPGGETKVAVKKEKVEGGQSSKKAGSAAAAAKKKTKTKIKRLGSQSVKKTFGRGPKKKKKAAAGATKGKSKAAAKAASSKARSSAEPEAPKRPLNAYMFFLKEKRPSVAGKFGEATQQVAAMWRELPAEEKKPYEAKATEARLAYEEAMKRHKAVKLEQADEEADDDAAAASSLPQRRLSTKQATPANRMSVKKEPSASSSSAVGKQSKGKAKAKLKKKRQARRISDDELGYRHFKKAHRKRFSATDGEEEMRAAWKTHDGRKECIKQALAAYNKQKQRQLEAQKRPKAFSSFCLQLVKQRQKLRVKDLQTMRTALPTWRFPEVLPQLTGPPPSLFDADASELPGLDAATMRAMFDRDEDDEGDDEMGNKTDQKPAAEAPAISKLFEIDVEMANPTAVGRSAVTAFYEIKRMANRHNGDISSRLHQIGDIIKGLAENLDPCVWKPTKPLASILGKAKRDDKTPEDGLSLAKHLIKHRGHYPPQIQALVTAPPDTDTRYSVAEERAKMVRDFTAYAKKIGKVQQHIQQLLTQGQYRRQEPDLSLSVEHLGLDKAWNNKPTAKNAKLFSKTLYRYCNEVVGASKELTVLYSQFTYIDQVIKKIDLTQHDRFTQQQFKELRWNLPIPLGEADSSSVGEVGERSGCGSLKSRDTIGGDVQLQLGINASAVCRGLREEQREWQLLPAEVTGALRMSSGAKDIMDCGACWGEIHQEVFGRTVTEEYRKWAMDGFPPEAACEPFATASVWGRNTWYCELCKSWRSKYDREDHMACGVRGGKPKVFGPCFFGDSFGLSMKRLEALEAGKVRVQLSANFAPLLARLGWACYWPADDAEVAVRLLPNRVSSLDEASSDDAAGLPQKMDDNMDLLSGSSSAAASSAASAAARRLSVAGRGGAAAAKPEAAADDMGPQFTLASCSDLDCAKQPEGFQLPLFTAQQRTVAWMKDREDRTLEYLSREVITRRCLGSDANVQLRVDRHWKSTRGGVLADSVGYGKTACMIGVIHDGLRKPMSEVLSPQELRQMSSKFIVSNATLVITPPNLFEQWLGEFKKFLKEDEFDSCRIIEVPHIHRLNKLSVEDLANADVVVVPYRFFFSGVYDRYMDETIGRDPDWSDLEVVGARGQELRYVILRDFVKRLLQAHGREVETPQTAEDDATGGATNARPPVSEAAAGDALVAAPLGASSSACAAEAEADVAMAQVASAVAAEAAASAASSASTAAAADVPMACAESGAAVSASSACAVDASMAPSAESSAAAAAAEEPMDTADPSDATSTKKQRGEPREMRTTVCGQELSVDILERMAPTLEAFYWRRVVFDEFHEVMAIREGRAYHALRQCHAKFHWGLTATPRLGSAKDISDMASLLHISIPPHNSREAQHFLDEWVRSSTWDTNTIPMENRVIEVRHTKQERLLYMHQKNAVAVNGRINMQAEEHLLQLCSHYDPTGDADDEEEGGGAQFAVLRRRQQLHQQLEEVTESLNRAIADLPALRERWEASQRLRRCFRAMGLAQGRQLNLQDAWKLAGEYTVQQMNELIAKFCRLSKEAKTEMAKDDEVVGQADADLPHPKESAPMATEAVINPELRVLIEGLVGLAIKTKTKSYKPKFSPVGRELEALVNGTESQIQRETNDKAALERSVRFFENTLQSLEEDGGECEECPICLESTTPADRGITSCGHVFHEDCIRMVVQEHDHCPTCRTSLKIKDISTVREMVDDKRSSSAEVQAGEAPKHGSKMARIVEELRAVRRKEPGAKVIMFCQWEKMMKFISKTLVELGEKAPMILKGSMAVRQYTIRDFIGSKKPEHSVLLLSLEKSPTGMNLVNCHHLFLIHPMYARTKERAVAYELQAIGRLRRMGQKEKVIVHRFVTKGTIEEEITQRHQTHLDEVDERQRSGDKEALVDAAKVEEEAAAKNGQDKGGAQEAPTEVQEALLAEVKARAKAGPSGASSSSAAAASSSSSSGGSSGSVMNKEASSQAAAVKAEPVS